MISSILQALYAGANALVQAGAKEVYAVATHAIFSKDAVKRINDSVITRVVVTDTIELNLKSNHQITKSRLDH